VLDEIREGEFQSPVGDEYTEEGRAERAIPRAEEAARRAALPPAERQAELDVASAAAAAADPQSRLYSEGDLRRADDGVPSDDSSRRGQQQEAPLADRRPAVAPVAAAQGP
jgi:hypothetical protein